MSWLALAWRSLRRSRAFSASAVATIAIGIGATTAIFSVVNTVLLQPLAYPEPDRLAGAWFAFPGLHFDRGPQSLATYFTYKKLARTIEGIALADPTSVNVADASGEGTPERVHGAMVTASYFPVLGVPLARGRGFTEAEDVPNGDPVAVISDAFWRAHFAGDPAIIGRAVRIDGRTAHIVGVLRPDVPVRQTDIFVPMQLDPSATFSGAFGHRAMVRLKPGVTLEQVRREFDALLPRSAELYPMIAPGTPMAEFLAKSRAHAMIRPLREDVIGAFRPVLWIAASAGALLLLIACANVASLLLTRAEGKERELAVRAALGASPWRVLALFLGEATVLATVGGGLGIALAVVGTRALVQSNAAQIPRLVEVSVSAPVVAFAIGVAALIALLCSAVPALRSDRRALAVALRAGGRTGTAGRDRQRARRTLVMTQVAFAMVLVAGATLLLRSLSRLRDVRPGFDPTRSVVMWVSLPSATYRRDTAVMQFTERLVDRMQQLPGVQAVGIASKLPLETQGQGYSPVWPDNDQTPSGTLPPVEQIIAASGGYFAAMGIPLLAGRTFDGFGRQGPFDAIVDQALATQYWHDSSGATAVGRRLRAGPIWYTVVGVVGSVRDTSLASPATGHVYLPQAIAPDTNQSALTRTMALVVRTSNPASARDGSLLHAMQRALHELDSTLPGYDVGSLAEVTEQSVARVRFVMLVLAVVAGVALALAAVGIYGVLAYMVSLRRREIGVRLALGATAASVAGLVTRQGLVLAVTGVGAGALIFVVLSRFLRALLYGVGVGDPLTVMLVALVLLATAALASWVPARRAARVDPSRVLGEE